MTGSSGTATTSGNHLTGDYTITAIGASTDGTQEQITGTSASSTLSQTDTGSSTLTQQPKR